MFAVFGIAEALEEEETMRSEMEEARFAVLKEICHNLFRHQRYNIWKKQKSGCEKWHCRDGFGAVVYFVGKLGSRQSTECCDGKFFCHNDFPVGNQINMN